MKNDKFPTMNMFVETLKEFLGKYMSPSYLQGNRLQRNLLGLFIDNGYDVMSEVDLDKGQKIDLFVRLSEGFMPIEIKIMPDNEQSINKSLEHLSSIVNNYKDIHSGYLICLVSSDQKVFKKGSNLLHETNNENVLWWGGRLIKEGENPRSLVEPYWLKAKLGLYGLKRNED